MKRVFTIIIVIFIVKFSIAQTIINNVPKEVIKLLEQDIIVESYCKFKINGDVVSLDVIPFNKKDSLEIYLYRNSNRVIQLSKKQIKVIANEDFLLVTRNEKDYKNKSDSILIEKPSNNSNGNYFLYKYTLSGKFIGSFKYQ